METIAVLTGHDEIIDYASIPREIFDRYAELYAQGLKNLKMTRAESEAA